jgi:hypothetical protein
MHGIAQLAIFCYNGFLRSVFAVSSGQTFGETVLVRPYHPLSHGKAAQKYPCEDDMFPVRFQKSVGFRKPGAKLMIYSVNSNQLQLNCI